jgi:hypothetical protein
MGLWSAWRRLTGNFEPVEPDGAADYEERLRVIERRLNLGKQELDELAMRVRVAEIALGVRTNGPEQDREPR